MEYHLVVECMKTRYKIIIPAIVFLAIGLFYLYIVANGYSPYVEGIGMDYHAETDTSKIMENLNLQSINELSDEDLKDVPKIKGMLEIALKQELPLDDDGFALFDESLNSYWFNREGSGLRVQISMGTDEANYYGEWLEWNVANSLVKYKERFFSFYQWIA